MEEKNNLSVQDMLDMQYRIYNEYGEPYHWDNYTPENARMYWLWTLGEAGEVIDALKKNSLENLMKKGQPRDHLIEEMADTMMFFVSTMACMNVSSEEFSKAYQQKHEYNMNRWKKKHETE